MLMPHERDFYRVPVHQALADKPYAKRYEVLDSLPQRVIAYMWQEGDSVLAKRNLAWVKFDKGELIITLQFENGIEGIVPQINFGPGAAAVVMRQRPTGEPEFRFIREIKAYVTSTQQSANDKGMAREFLTLPAGHVGVSDTMTGTYPEDPITAAAREAREEGRINVDTTSARIIGKDCFRDPSAGPSTYDLVLFREKPLDLEGLEEPEPLEHIVGTAWYTFSQLDEMVDEGVFPDDRTVANIRRIETFLKKDPELRKWYKEAKRIKE